MSFFDRFKTDPAPVPPEPARPTEPAYITAEQLAAREGALLARLEGMAAGLRGSAPSGEPSGRAAEPAITAQDIEDRLAKGEPVAAALDSLVNERVARAEARLTGTALPALEASARSIALAAIPKEHTKYVREIEKAMSMAPPEARLDPQSWKGAYALVIGSHHEELVAEAREAAMRQAGERPVERAASPTMDLADGRRFTVPTLADFAGDEGIAALQEKRTGRDADGLAQSLGYKDWPAYMRLAAEQDAAPIDEYPNLPGPGIRSRHAV